MPADLPYLPTYKNVGKLFEKIAAAKTPDTFTHPFLYETLGLKSVGDRPLIPLLKSLGFLDQSGKPTAQYHLLKNKSTSGRAIAEAVRSAYEPLFAANENAHRLTPDELKGLVAQVSGADTKMTAKICGTLNGLIKLADFSPSAAEGNGGSDEEEESSAQEGTAPATGLRPEFHYNIQIHLPGNGTEETYLNIFNAVRRAFK
jgi:hypothetical protein